MSKTLETHTINIRPKWETLTKEYIRIIRNNEAVIHEKGATGERKLESAKNIDALIKDLTIPAKILDIILDLFEKEGNNVVVKITKESDGNLKIYTKEPIAK